MIFLALLLLGLLACCAVHAVAPGEPLMNTGPVGPHGYHPWSSKTFRLSGRSRSTVDTFGLPGRDYAIGSLDAMAGALSSDAIGGTVVEGSSNAVSAYDSVRMGVYDRSRYASLWAPPSDPVDGVAGMSRFGSSGSGEATSASSTSPPDTPLSIGWSRWTVTADDNGWGWLRVGGDVAGDGILVPSEFPLIDACHGAQAVMNAKCMTLYAVAMDNIEIDGVIVGGSASTSNSSLAVIDTGIECIGLPASEFSRAHDLLQGPGDHNLTVTLGGTRLPLHGAGGPCVVDSGGDHYSLGSSLLLGRSVTFQPSGPGRVSFVDLPRDQRMGVSNNIARQRAGRKDSDVSERDSGREENRSTHAMYGMPSVFKFSAMSEAPVVSYGAHVCPSAPGRLYEIVPCGRVLCSVVLVGTGPAQVAVLALDTGISGVHMLAIAPSISPATFLFMSATVLIMISLVVSIMVKRGRAIAAARGGRGEGQGTLLEVITMGDAGAGYGVTPYPFVDRDGNPIVDGPVELPPVHCVVIPGPRAPVRQVEEQVWVVNNNETAGDDKENQSVGADDSIPAAGGDGDEEQGEEIGLLSADHQ